MTMEQIFIKYINTFFNSLIDVFGFTVKDEFDDGQSYLIEYSSKTFVIKIEKYFREFYAALYRLDDSQEEINLLNLLDYLNQDNEIKLVSESFHQEKNIEECYKKQLNQISTLIYDNFPAINDFFKSDDYKSKVISLKNYIINKHPELFKRG